jgi:hypothetical protein
VPPPCRHMCRGCSSSRQWHLVVLLYSAPGGGALVFSTWWWCSCIQQVVVLLYSAGASASQQVRYAAPCSRWCDYSNSFWGSGSSSSSSSHQVKWSSGQLGYSAYPRSGSLCTNVLPHGCISKQQRPWRAQLRPCHLLRAQSARNLEPNVYDCGTMVWCEACG